MRLPKWLGPQENTVLVQNAAKTTADPIIDGMDKTSQEAIFKNLMAIAGGIRKVNPSALPEFISAILRPEQSESIIRVAEHGQSVKADINPFSFFFDVDFRDIFLEQEYAPAPSKPPILADYPLRLGRDTVLTCPWKDGGFINCLAMIGSGKLTSEQTTVKRQQLALEGCEPGPWKQFKENHLVLLWLPWRIGFVSNGNHSLAAGILAAEGTVVPSAVDDYSSLFALMVCDGCTFSRKKDGSKIADVTNGRRAAVFEIGRLIFNEGRGE